MQQTAPTEGTQETDEALAVLSLRHGATYNVLVERHREPLIWFIFKRFTFEVGQVLRQKTWCRKRS